jgi:5-methylthioadenosine/S-adenosylhomocysteine deaminase
MQHVRHLDPTRMPVERSLEMATINAATALGLENEIGSLEVGKRADIAIFDLRKPYVGVLHRPLSSFVTAGKGSDVRTVLVDGQVVYRDGVFKHCSEPQRLVAEAEKIGRAIVDKAGLGHRLAPAWRQ